MKNVPTRATAEGLPSPTRRLFLRSTAGVATLAGFGAVGVATGQAVAEQDPFLAMLNEYRCYLAAYSAAPFQTPAEEEAWCEANCPSEAAAALFEYSPAITTDDGALEAMRYVAQSDLVELDPAYARMPTMAVAHLEGRVAR